MCAGADWQREKVPDHKFDFIDTREFTDNGFMMRMKYLLLYAVVLKSFLVYISDLFSAITMVTTKEWSNQVAKSCPPELQKKEGCIPVDFRIGKWVFFGCIIFGFLLLAYEARKAKKIIKSRDISYAFTNVMANHYYSLRSYDHFCFFDHISNSTKKMDDFAFFVFFTFKGWKRLLLADGPRQAINAINLYSFYLSKSGTGNWYDFNKYFNNPDFTTNALTGTMLFTFVIFAGSLLLLIAAGICYIPLLMYIRGNLKEYCCHKVDKRIREILNRRNKQRQQRAMEQARKEAEGDFSHLKGKKGMDAALPMPTLPNVQLDDDEFDDGASLRTRGPPASTYAGSDYYDQKGNGAYSYDYNANYPPMPGYGGQQQQQQYNYYNQQPQQGYSDPAAMQAIYGEREPYFQDNYGSQATLAQQQHYSQQGYGQRDQSNYAHSEMEVPGSGLAYDYPSPQPQGAGPLVRTGTPAQHARGPSNGQMYGGSHPQGHGYDTQNGYYGHAE